MVGGQAALLAQSPLPAVWPGGPGGHLRTSIAEYNACMGKIVAAPTAAAAASCPECRWPPRRRTAFSDDELVMALLAAAAIDVRLRCKPPSAARRAAARPNAARRPAWLRRHSPSSMAVPGGGGARLCLCADEYAGPGDPVGGLVGSTACTATGGVCQAVSAAQLALGVACPIPWTR